MRLLAEMFKSKKGSHSLRMWKSAFSISKCFKAKLVSQSLNLIDMQHYVMPSDGETPTVSLFLEHKAQLEPRNCLSLWLALELALLLYG